jgi:oxygen-independent coproporphyrinogen-3 oxidase
VSGTHDEHPSLARPAPERTVSAASHDTRLTVLDQTGTGRARPDKGPTGAFAHDLLTQAAAAAHAAPHVHARSLYIHVPFCFHKCHYCDFYSIVDTRDRQSDFTQRLTRELAALAPFAGPLRTIFVGGGTPSLLRVDLWRDLLASLHAQFDMRDIVSGASLPPRNRATEFTVECNPETVTPELFAVLREGGVDRVSIGAQSFEPRHLKTLERWHEPENVGRAVRMARDAGIQRVSVDLIFAIPGQTVAEWRRDLETAIALGVDHVSCYNLTYEANTAMTARMTKGEFTPMDEDTEIEMYHATWEILRGRGFERYEVSNYAKPGQESRHNLAYWRQAQWLAAGPSASAHVAGMRWKNRPRLDDYLTIEGAGTSGVLDAEGVDEGRAVRERIMTGLRLREGLDGPVMLAEAERVSPTAAAKLEKKVSRYVERGVMRVDGRIWSLTDDGILVADAIASDLMGCV